VNDAKLAKKVLTHEKCMTKTQVIIQNIPFGEGLFTVNESKLIFMYIFIINLGNHWCLFFLTDSGWSLVSETGVLQIFTGPVFVTLAQGWPTCGPNRIFCGSNFNLE
jgi:hypothetical protein